MVEKKESGGRTILQGLVDPIMPKFKLNDLLQVIVGASILAVPIGFTEETWVLGSELPVLNILGLLVLSLFFISMFTYYHYHKNRGGNSKRHRDVFVKRVFSTYILSFIVVAAIMTLIQKAPWGSDWVVAFKRIAIVTFPSSLSAAIADTIK